MTDQVYCAKCQDRGFYEVKTQNLPTGPERFYGDTLVTLYSCAAECQRRTSLQRLRDTLEWLWRNYD